MKIFLSCIAVISVLMITWGCSGGANYKVTILGKKYPALAADAPVEVIIHGRPGYRVSQIGIVQTICALADGCIETAKIAARENGGDVIVMGSNQGKPGDLSRYIFEIFKKVK